VHRRGLCGPSYAPNCQRKRFGEYDERLRLVKPVPYPIAPDSRLLQPVYATFRPALAAIYTVPGNPDQTGANPPALAPRKGRIAHAPALSSRVATLCCRQTKRISHKVPVPVPFSRPVRSYPSMRDTHAPSRTCISSTERRTNTHHYHIPGARLTGGSPCVHQCSSCPRA
jgi:hypothetical protein